VPAAGASPLRQEDHGAGPTKTAGCKQDNSGARGGRGVNVVPDEPEVKAGTLRERLRPGALKNLMRYRALFRNFAHIFRL